jgi:hypothetical protein
MGLTTKKALRKSLITIAFYVAAALLIELLDRVSPGGPCNPGLGDMLFILLIPGSAIFFFISLYKTIRTDRINVYPTIIHLLVFVAILICLRMG